MVIISKVSTRSVLHMPHSTVAELTKLMGVTRAAGTAGACCENPDKLASNTALPAYLSILRQVLLTQTIWQEGCRQEMGAASRPCLPCPGCLNKIDLQVLGL